MYASNSNLLNNWLQLARHYQQIQESDELAQHLLYAANYYQYALIEPNINRQEIETIYHELTGIKKRLIIHLIKQLHLKFNEQQIAAIKSDVRQVDIKNSLTVIRHKYKSHIDRLNIAKGYLSIPEVEKAINLLYESNDVLKDILTELWADSALELQDFSNGFPCGYAVIAFGSLADGLATLHSDLEFGILISDERHKNYFRCIAQLMQFNTILLGETALNILRPPEYGNPDFAELFKQCRIPNGISFDGAGEGGGKTPLGVKGIFELIGTPAELARYQQRDWSGTQYRTLPLDIAHAVFVIGKQDLFNNYCNHVRQHLQQLSSVQANSTQNLTCGQQRALTQLTADLERFAPKMGRETSEGRDYAAKHDFLRLPVLAIRHLALFNNIMPAAIPGTATTWQLLNQLGAHTIFQSTQITVLKELLCLSSLIRLDCYLTLREQAERITVKEEHLHFITTKERSYGIPVTLRDKLYTGLLSLYDALQAWRQKCEPASLYFQTYNSQHPEFQARMAEHLLQYEVADQRYQFALTITHSDALQINMLLAHRARLQGKQWDSVQTTLAIKNYQRILENYQSKLNKDSLAVANCRAALASQYALLGKYDQALTEINEAIRCFTLQRGNADLETTHCEMIQQEILQIKQQDQLLLQKLYDACQRRHEDPAVQQGLVCYVESQATEILGGEAKLELMPQLHGFLANEQLRELLLFGDSGSGKSLNLYYFEKELWKVYEEREEIPTYVPIFVELKLLHNIKNHEFLPDFLQREYGYSAEQIQQLKHSYKFIFIFDGYDELSGDLKNRSLYQDAIHYRWNAKVIISCRTQYLHSRQDSNIQFGIQDASRVTVSWYLAAFEKRHIERYLQKYLQQPSSIVRERVPNWQAENYLAYYQATPGIADLIRSPLLLRIVTEALSTLQREFGNQTTPVKRHQIYAAFIQHWFEREAMRAIAQVNEPANPFYLQLSKEEQNFVRTLSQLGTMNSFYYFAQTLAFNMYLENMNDVHYQEPHYPGAAKSIWHLFFGLRDKAVERARMACPLRRIGDSHYSFMHRSFMEYFVANHLYQTLPVENIAQSSLGKKLLHQETGILAFLAERIETEQDKQRWFAIIEYSRKKKSKAVSIKLLSAGLQADEKQKQNAIKTAAANAITVLNQAGISFSGHDLSAVRIKGADVSQGIFHQTNFQQANLKQVNFRQAFLREANLSGAKMQDITFGEQAYLQTNSAINIIAHSPDGEYIAVGCNDGQIYVFKYASGAVVTSWVGRAYSPIKCLLWRNSTIIWGGDNNSIKILDFRKPLRVKTLLGHEEEINCLAWHGSQLASGAKDNTIRLWDLSAYCQIGVLRGHYSAIKCLAYRADGEELASGSNDYTIHLWNLRTREYTMLRGHRRPVSCLAYHPDGLQLASGSQDKVIKIWDLSKQPITHQSLSGHEDFISTLCYHPTGNYLMSAGWDKVIRLWDIKNSKVFRTLRGHQDYIFSLSLPGSGQYLASGSIDKALRIWEVPDKALEHSELRPSYEKVIALATDEDDYIVAKSRGRVEWLKNSMGQMRSRPQVQTDELSINCLAAYGKELAIGSHNGIVQLWEVNTGQALLRKTFSVHNTLITCLYLNDKVLMAGQDEAVHVWDRSNGAPLHTWQHTKKVSCLAQHQRNWVSGSEDNSIQVGNQYSRNRIATLSGHTEAVTCLASHNEQLASGSKDETIRIWIGEKCVQILSEHRNPIIQLAFTRKKDELISWDKGGCIIVWQLHHGSYGEIARQQLPPMRKVMYQANNNSFMSINADASLSYWQAVIDKWQLQWTNSPAILDMAGMQVDDQQLSEVNRLLWQQRR